mmetsp:Transcript_29653/g.84812  ORF Transcript_29653/g.84812 Transcript_29653/m.84812 type:complete len:214 (+) Transcript_29653:681-1322(+)
MQLQQPLQLLESGLCELVEHPGHRCASAVATQRLDDGRYVLLHLTSRRPSLCLWALLHEHCKDDLEAQLIHKDLAICSAVPQSMVCQAEGEGGGKDVLAHHPDHELQPLGLPEGGLVRRQQHQGAEAVEHVLHELRLLAVRWVSLPVGRNTSQQLVGALEPHHGFAARGRALQHDAQDLGGVDAVVVDVPLCPHPLDQPRQELWHRAKLLAGL